MAVTCPIQKEHITQWSSQLVSSLVALRVSNPPVQETIPLTVGHGVGTCFGGAGEAPHRVIFGLSTLGILTRTGCNWTCLWLNVQEVVVKEDVS